MQISNLPASGSFSGTDVLAIEVNGITYRLTGATLAAALETIGNYVSASDYPITVEHGGTGASNAAAARSNLGLGNVNNTSDADKPVSTEQAAALALKLNSADYKPFTGATGNTPGLAGIVPAPTSENQYLGSEGVWRSPDATPTEDSTALITSAAVFEALNNKQNALTFDTAPTNGSTNPVTSGGVYTAIQQSTAELLPTTNLATSALYRNSFGRGKNLGTFTSDMSDDIKAGDFSGFGIGDTFKYGNRTHTIVHFDPDIACGDNISLGHHIAIVSDGGWSSQWNTTNNTVTGGVNGGAGYVDSTVRAYIKSSGGPQEQIIGDFGSGHVLSYRALYPSTYDSNGKATGWAWVDARSELLNETQVYGHQVWGQNGYEDGIDKFKLAIFRLMPSFMNIRASWWLRSVDSATYAALVDGTGAAANDGARYSIGVRPLSLIA